MYHDRSSEIDESTERLIGGLEVDGLSLRSISSEGNGKASRPTNKGARRDTIPPGVPSERRPFILKGVTYYCKQLYLLVDSESSSPTAFTISIFWKLAIVVSIISYVAQMEPSLRHYPKSCSHPACYDDPESCPGRMICEGEAAEIFNTIDFVCIVIFTVEYSLRFLTCWAVSPRVSGILPWNWDHHHKLSDPLPSYSCGYRVLKWVFQMRNMVDLICFLPVYITVLLKKDLSSDFVRTLRVLRMFRTLRMVRYIGLGKNSMVMLKLIPNTFRRSAPVLVVFLVCSLLGMVFFSCIIYAFESGQFTVTPDYPDGVYLRKTADQAAFEVSPFTSVTTSMYWAVVTGTTTGYGDITPTSPMGRGIAIILMFLGLFSIALPVGVLGANFTREYNSNFPTISSGINNNNNATSASSSSTRESITGASTSSVLTGVTSSDRRPEQYQRNYGQSLSPVPLADAREQQQASPSSDQHIQYQQQQQYQQQHTNNNHMINGCSSRSLPDFEVAGMFSPLRPRPSLPPSSSSSSVAAKNIPSSLPPSVALRLRTDLDSMAKELCEKFAEEFQRKASSIISAVADDVVEETSSVVLYAAAAPQQDNAATIGIVAVESPRLEEVDLNNDGSNTSNNDHSLLLQDVPSPPPLPLPRRPAAPP